MAESVLIIGAQGFIGRSLGATLSAAGYACEAANRPLGTQETSLSHRIALLDRHQFVVHAATGSTPASSQASSHAEVASNLLDLAGWLDALQARPRPLLYLSSAGSIYGGHDGQPARESDLSAPRSYHGAGKVAAEQFIAAWSRHSGQAAVMLRPSNVYGPGQRAAPGFGVIPHAIDCLLNQREMTIWGDGSSERDYLYIDDLCSLCLAVLARFPASGAHLANAAAGNSTRLDELLALLQAISGRTLATRHVQARRFDADIMRVDPALAKRTWGWRARTSLAEGLATTWAWAEARHAGE